MKGKTNKSAFDFFRNRAKKTLTNSFESLITNVQHKTDEVREAFRHRSGTNESEGGSFSRSVVCIDSICVKGFRLSFENLFTYLP